MGKDTRLSMMSGGSKTPFDSRRGSMQASHRADPAHVTVIGLAMLVFVALRAPCAAIPLERDEGEYAYIAQRMLHGELPYRDAFDQKPPGVFLAYLVPVRIFGTSVVAIHVTAYIWSALTALFVYLCARRM